MSKDIVPFDSNLFELMKFSSEDALIPMPFVTDFFLLDIFVAGTSYIENLEEIWNHLEIDQNVIFKREPHNPYDEMAILILDEKSRKMGYVPRDMNQVLARLMDAGKLLYGKINDMQWRDGYASITLQVFLRDV